MLLFYDNKYGSAEIMWERFVEIVYKRHFLVIGVTSEN